MKKINYIGQKKHKLLCIDDLGIRNGQRWLLCRCECGNKKELRAGHFGITKSCGCIIGCHMAAYLKERWSYKKAPSGFVKIKGLENRYSVNKKGEVWSHSKGCIKALAVDSRGYTGLTWEENGKMKQERIHRIVARTFIPNPENKPEVNHIDNDPSNNNVENLEWCTRQENMTHAKEQLRMTRNFKTKESMIDYIKANNNNYCNGTLESKFWFYLGKHGLELKKEKVIDKNSKKYREDIDTLMNKTKNNMAEVGRVLGISRERVRQIFTQMGKVDWVLYDGSKEVYRTPFSGKGTSNLH